MKENYIEIVENLNQDLFEKLGLKNYNKLGWMFKLVSNGC